jgi:hypothetical protein
MNWKAPTLPIMENKTEQVAAEGNGNCLASFSSILKAHIPRRVYSLTQKIEETCFS